MKVLVLFLVLVSLPNSNATCAQLHVLYLNALLSTGPQYTAPVAIQIAPDYKSPSIERQNVENVFYYHNLLQAGNCPH